MCTQRLCGTETAGLQRCARGGQLFHHRAATARGRNSRDGDVGRPRLCVRQRGQRVRLSDGVPDRVRYSFQRAGGGSPPPGAPRRPTARGLSLPDVYPAQNTREYIFKFFWKHYITFDDFSSEYLTCLYFLKV